MRQKYRKLRKWLVLLRFDKKNHPRCQDCVWEARADLGVYRDSESLSEDKQKRFEGYYKDEYYYAHLDPQGYRSKVRVR